MNSEQDRDKIQGWDQKLGKSENLHVREQNVCECLVKFRTTLVSLHVCIFRDIKGPNDYDKQTKILPLPSPPPCLNKFLKTKCRLKQSMEKVILFRTLQDTNIFGAEVPWSETPAPEALVRSVGAGAGPFEVHGN